MKQNVPRNLKKQYVLKIDHVCSKSMIASLYFRFVSDCNTPTTNANNLTKACSKCLNNRLYDIVVHTYVGR